MTDIRLAGCTPTPLSSYLKALGVLRVVALQSDPAARGWWHGDMFHLRSTLDESTLVHLLCRDYEPAPVLGPWNGGSGFYWKWDERKRDFKDREACKLLRAIHGATHSRFARYVVAIDAVLDELFRLADDFDPAEADKKERDAALILRRDADVKAIPKAVKDRLLLELRARVPDDVLEWLDAAWVLNPDGQASLPLLGSGGNDGNLDFSVTYMGCLHEVLALKADEELPEGTEPLLRQALLHEDHPLVGSFSPGQFNPQGIGGPNSTEGFEGSVLVNPWDFILMVEGAMMFAGSVARRFAVARARVSFPFTVTQSNVTAAGSGSMAPPDRQLVRGETWLPIWENPASLRELTAVFAEGRVQVGRRQAVTSLDFARAAISLGVARGITGFERVGYLKRNGRSYIAAPLGRVRVRFASAARLLDQAELFLGRLRRFCSGDRASGTAVAALWRVEDAIFRFCKEDSPRRLQEVLAALGAAERAVARSSKSREVVSPLSGLNRAWLEHGNDGSDEFDLARALASIWDRNLGPIRHNLEPVELHPKLRWVVQDSSVVWGSGALANNLVHVLKRRLLEAERVSNDPEKLGEMRARVGSKLPVPLRGAMSARPESIVRFIAGETDDDRIEDLLWALASLPRREWAHPQQFAAVEAPEPPDLEDSEIAHLDQGETVAGNDDVEGDVDVVRQSRAWLAGVDGLPRAYMLLKLVLLPSPIHLSKGAQAVEISPEPDVVYEICSGHHDEAVARAIRRLRAAGLRPPGTARRHGKRAPRFVWNPPDPIRVAAALLIPVWPVPFIEHVLDVRDTNKVAVAEGASS